MTPLNSVTVVPALLKFQKSLIGRPYRSGGGHAWHLGQAIPWIFDCSGFEYVTWSFTTSGAINIAGTSETEWEAGEKVLKERIPANDPLAPGDTLLFYGSDYAPPGHVGTCVTYDPKTKQGTFISAFDTADGVCIKPFIRDGGVGGMRYYGAIRTANLLPAPPAPAPLILPPAQGMPTGADLVRANLVLLITHAEAVEALSKGFALYYWSKTHFVPQVSGQPTNTHLYANAKAFPSK